MRQKVYRRVDRIAGTHMRAKEGRYGFLVRPVTLALGWTVLIIGLITIPLPGQGWLTTFFGVGLLSLEQNWARRLLRFGVQLYDRFYFWFKRQPRAFRITAVSLLVFVIWAVFLGVAWGTWKSGSLDFLTPYLRDLGVLR